MAYTKLIDESSNITEIKSQFLEAVKISDSLQDETTMLDVSIDICKFYLHQKQKDSALYYAEKSYDLATKISNNDLLLESIQILADLKGGEEGMAYLKRHIALSDSLLQVERNFRDKYARVEYETDQLEEENKLFSQQKIWLAAISAGLLIALGLV